MLLLHKDDIKPKDESDEFGAWLTGDDSYDLSRTDDVMVGIQDVDTSGFPVASFSDVIKKSPIVKSSSFENIDPDLNSQTTTKQEEEVEEEEEEEVEEEAEEEDTKSLLAGLVKEGSSEIEFDVTPDASHDRSCQSSAETLFPYNPVPVVEAIESDLGIHSAPDDKPERHKKKYNLAKIKSRLKIIRRSRTAEEDNIQIQDQPQQNVDDLGSNVYKDMPSPDRGDTSGILNQMSRAGTYITKLSSVERLSVDETHILVNKKIMDMSFGDEWYDWEPETISQTILTDLNQRITDQNLDELMAVKILYKTDAFWEKWNVFEAITTAINNELVMHDQLQQPSPEKMAYSCNVVDKLMGSRPYGDEVEIYVASNLYLHGMVVAPKSLQFAQEKLSLILADHLKSNEFVSLQKASVKRYREAVAGKTTLKETKPDIQAMRLLIIDEYITSMNKLSKEL